MTTSPARYAWANVLFWLTVLLVILLTAQQGLSGGSRGSSTSLVVAFLIPAPFPIGMAYWGKRTGMIGPALGAMSMLLLLWLALVISQS
ncbi:MAG: hypothetical protein IT337_12330 [Thermomicrobiales bacterium]|nr:hypothetical protein [Thermomicrobiales bacterium]